MKNAFKRALSAIAALAITATCMTSATMPTFFASAEDFTGNVALNYATAYASDTNPYEGKEENSIDKINDGDQSKGWQARNEANDGGSVMCGLNFKVPALVSSVTVYTKNQDADSDGTNAGKTTVTYNGGTVVSIADVEGQNQMLVTFDPPVELTNIEFTFNESDKYCPKIWEIEVQGTIASIDIAKLALEELIAVADAKVEENYTPETWEVFAAALADAKEAINSDDESVVTNAQTALQTASAGLLDNSEHLLELAVEKANAVIRYRYTAETLAALDAELAKVETTDDPAALITSIETAIANLATDNLALNMTQITATGDNVGWGNAVPRLNDGDYSTRWQSGSGSNTIDEYAGVNFGTSTTFDVLEVYYETSRPKQEYVQYSQDGIIWSDVSNLAITGSLAETVTVGNTNAYYRCYTFDAVKAQYVRIRLIGAYDNWNYNMSIHEFEAYNSLKTEFAEDTAPDEKAVAKYNLEQSIIAAENKIASGFYTQDTLDTLNSAIASAETLLANSEATAQQLNDANTAVVNATNGLVEEDADAILQEALVAAAAVEAYKYTADSIAALNAEVAKAETVTEAADKLTLATAINEAIANLVGDNLALNKDQVTASPNVGYGNEIPRLNDGNMGSRWQSDLNANDVDDFAGINFGSAVTFDTIEVYYEVCRPNKETVQYSQDGVTWNDVPNVTVSGSLDTTVEGTTDRYFRKFSFSAIKAQYVRVYMEGAKGYYYANMSIWEFEVYNTTKAELDAPTTVHYELAVFGAQTRDSVTVDGAKDMRFVAVVDVNLWAANADKITDIGVLLARADQLESAGVDATDLTLDFNNADVIVKKLSAVYFNNSNDQGYYEYYATITGITDEYSDRQYTAVAYYVIDGVAYYATPVTRCVNDYVA